MALARNAEKAKDLGAAVRVADCDRPKTFKTAPADVDKLLLISGNAVGWRVA